MKNLTKAVCFASLLCFGRAGAAETYEEATKRVAAEYAQKAQAAATELIQTRERIAGEKAPLLKAMRAAEDRIIGAQTQIRQLETGQEEEAGRRRKLIKNIEAARKTTAFVASVLRDGTKVFEDSLAPGESQLVSDRLHGLQQKLDQATATGTESSTLADLADLLAERTERAVGGYTAPGRAVLANNSEAVAGTLAFVGPSTYFLPAQGGPAGAVWTGNHSTLPVSTPLPDWNVAAAKAFFSGETGTLVADVTGGKALRLKETEGTLLNKLNSGGAVAYVIVAVGGLALLLILQKIGDLFRMNLDTPEKVAAFLAKVARATPAEINKLRSQLRGATQELFVAGLRHLNQPRHILEEHLESVLLRQRAQGERRLPLLAVIATAAPLMGLLGTVVGMVKTFALITVFGTGNAAKLASGISQVLVATELGLIVAIPTLIAHGFLAHRIHRNLALLERYALEFVTAAKGPEQEVAIREDDAPELA